MVKKQSPYLTVSHVVVMTLVIGGNSDVKGSPQRDQFSVFSTPLSLPTVRTSSACKIIQYLVIGCFLPKCTMGVFVNVKLEVFMSLC